MGFKTSYSQNSTYISCPKHWWWLYEQRLKSPKEGASLYFGSAVDNAIMTMLSDFDKGITQDYVKKFVDRWTVAFSNNKAVDVFDHPTITYAHSDFDEHILDTVDISRLDFWANELNLNDLGSNGVEIFKAAAKIKKNPYKNITPAQLKFFNRASWLSLKRKGELLVDAFQKQFLPKVKKVIATQKYARIEDNIAGDSIVGVIDMVLEIEGYDQPIIFDLKTAALPYTAEQIELTDQLTLYAAMKGGEFNTNKVGYVVLCKAIPKDTLANCQLCNNAKDGRHKTCNAVINGIRCNGEWLEKIVPKPEVQVLVETKTQQQVDDLLNDVANIVIAMKNKIVYKNTNKCHNWFGSRCQYYEACHKGDTSGLIKK